MCISCELNKFITDFSCNCNKVQKKTFSKGQTITSYITKRKQFCILLSGRADLIRYDSNGNRTIIENFSKNSLFGEVFYKITMNNELLVESKSKCTVLFYNYDDLKHPCDTSCKFHNTLNEYLPELILDKITELNTRIELLTQRTTRNKLLMYFFLISSRKDSKSFELPLSLTDLADYLSIDRSAMMRELKLLKEEGIVEKNGNRITLL